MLWKVLTIALIVLTVHFGLLFVFRPSAGNDSNFPSVNVDDSDNRTKLIIDTDAGGDDAVALLLVLAAVDAVRVIGITCTYGNTNETNVETNVLKILTIANRTDIPVYGGVEKPLLQSYAAGDYFGKDGLGDFVFGRPIRGAVVRSVHAVNAMIQVTRRYPGAISILTLGPLTNVALAASLDSNFTRNVKRFYVMGSTIVKKKNGEQQTKRKAEFNFGLDPESDAVFLKSPSNEKILVLPWDVVLDRNISKQWRTEIMGRLNTPTIDFLNKVEALVLNREATWLPADSIAVAVTLWPDMVTSSLEAHMAPITCEDTLNGAVVVDPDAPTKNVEIVRDFNVTAFKYKLLRYLG